MGLWLRRAANAAAPDRPDASLRLPPRGASHLAVKLGAGSQGSGSRLPGNAAAATGPFYSCGPVDSGAAADAELRR